MKSFLTVDELHELKTELPAPRTPDGDERAPAFGAREFSQKIIAKIEQKFSRHPLWLKIHPIALGSLARGELCACSDLDLLFLGPEELVSDFVKDFQKAGVKMRSRLPASAEDWSVGVEAFDVIALLHAKPYTDFAASELRLQTKIIEARGRAYARELLKSMSDERRARNQRFDSIANFLQPNLKFGPGGLRDLHQALNLHALFQNKFRTPFAASQTIEHGNLVLNYYLEFWLLLRHKMHLESGMDLLTASEQFGLSQWLGFKNNQEFMREVQKGISRVNFYSDLFFAFVKSTPAELAQITNFRLKEPMDCVRALQIQNRSKSKQEKSILLQSRIRFESKHIFKMASETKLKKANLKFLSLIHASAPDEVTHGLFRSRLIDQFIPDFKKIVGYVQHDQYHRFSVDAHLLQALRELKRVYAKPKMIGSLSESVKALREKDWEILSWTCLLHDLAKGRHGDHSKEGVELAKRYLAQFAVDKECLKEVLWMIDQHLLVSDAAFRKNPSAKSTLRELFVKGVVKERIARLTIFTAIDIRATNPEAWNSWKEKLLLQLVKALSAPEASAFIELEKAIGNLAEKNHDFIESLDPFLLSSVPSKVLAADLKKFLTRKAELAMPLVYQNSKREIWLRLYEPEDRAGVLFGLVEKLFQLKCSINHASITSDEKLGVYDWFQVHTNLKKSELIKRILKLEQLSSELLVRAPAQLEKVLFEKVELISQDQNEWIIAFTGHDQSGLLLKAAYALAEEGLNIKWAKVHTWGRQIQDLFSVSALSKLDSEAQVVAEALIEKLNHRVVHKK